LGSDLLPPMLPDLNWGSLDQWLECEFCFIYNQ
jgi:hypothetical protein